MMKKIFLFLTLMLPMVANAQEWNELTETQQDQIIFNCKKIGLYALRLLDNKGNETTKDENEMETFYLSFDRGGGCESYEGIDIFLKGQKFERLMKRPITVRKLYLDANNQSIPLTDYNNRVEVDYAIRENLHNNSILCFYIKKIRGMTNCGFYEILTNTNEMVNYYIIAAIDFYDTNGNIIVSGYKPYGDPDIVNGNFVRIFLDKIWEKYK